MAISWDSRGGHETLTLLSLPPRILCASTGHYPPPHRGACAAYHCQGPKIHGQLPQENTAHTSTYCNVMPASATEGSNYIAIMTTLPLRLPSLSEQESRNQPLLQPHPVWAGNRRLRATYMQRRCQNQS